MMKWILLLVIGYVIYMVATGNMGGARDATANYNKLLTGKPAQVEAQKEQKQ